MGARDEQLYVMFLTAAVAAGHRGPAALDSVATEALELHKRKYPDEPVVKLRAPAPDAPSTGSAPAAPAASGTNTDATATAGGTATTPEKPAKGKDASR